MVREQKEQGHLGALRLAWLAQMLRPLHPPIPTTASHSPDLAGASCPHLGHTKD